MPMKRLFLFLTVSVLALAVNANDIAYTADDVTIFPNPERGFTDQLGGELALTDSKNHVVQPEEEWYWDEEDENYPERKNQSLVMLMYYLKNYKTKDLSNKILQGFNEDMQILRNHGFKCVLRFAYDWSSKTDASLQWAQRHLEQLTPYLESNKDVIFALEAGFVGRWGEWYYSSNYGNETQELTPNRRAILQSLISACPSGRFLLVRYPLIKLSYLGDEVPLDSAQAYSSSARARIGHHNDAFLNAWGNDGTYGRNGDGPDDDPILRNYIAQETLYVPNGGETNVEENPLASIVAQYDTTMAELRRYHWTFCGSQYAEEVTNVWRTNGTFAEMERMLGYRFQLVTATLPDVAETGREMRVQLRLRNVGCAPLYNERHAYIVLKNGNSEYRVQLASDPRRWLPNGAETTIDETLTLPDNMPEGTYQLYLFLPDVAETLASDPRYAVRFANTNVWDATTGMNSLNASVLVSVPSDLDHAAAVSRPAKMIRDGKVFILRDGKRYSLTGQEQTQY